MVRFYTENSRPFFIWGSDPKKRQRFSTLVGLDSPARSGSEDDL